MAIYIFLVVFVGLPVALFMGKQIIIPALKDQPMFPMFQRFRSPEDRLKEARLNAERARVELEALEEEDKASRLRLQLEARQRQSHEQLIQDIKDGNFGPLTSLSDEDVEKRKEKGGRVKN